MRVFVNHETGKHQYLVNIEVDDSRQVSGKRIETRCFFYGSGVTPLERHNCGQRARSCAIGALQALHMIFSSALDIPDHLEFYRDGKRISEEKVL